MKVNNVLILRYLSISLVDLDFDPLWRNFWNCIIRERQGSSLIEIFSYSFRANVYVWRHQIMRTMHTWPDIFTFFSFWPWEKVQHVRSKIVTMFIKRFHNTYQIPWIFRNKFYQNTLSCNLIYIQWTNCEKYMYI